MRLALTSILFLSLVQTPGAQRPATEPPGYTPHSAAEQSAVAVVREWLAGWEAKDPQRVAATMATDVLWAGAFPTDPLNGIWRGRDRFVQQDGFAVRGGVKFTVAEELAVGGPAGVAVLQRRVDEGGFGPYGFGAGRGGRGVFFTNAVFYWVKDGKIAIWLDAPISANSSRDQAPPIDSWAENERAALDVVKGWVAAWNAKDADKVASFMADDVSYSTYYPTNITEVGRAHFLEGHRRNITQGVDMRIAQSLAVGGPRGYAVLLRRIDRFTAGARQVEVPTAAFFWVADGRIQHWRDLPLETPPSGAGGALLVR